MIKIRRKKIDTNMLVAQEREHILSQDTDFFIRESYNTLRSNVTFSLTGKGCKIVAVTSTNPGEGKSITALNIAVAYAEINKKVLLIAGGGTLGTYTAKELLRLGCYVDVLCPEDKESDNEKNISYIPQ